MAKSPGEWNLPSPPGFQGLREDLRLLTYQQKLPHWRQEGATYFITFRLGDSLPQSKLAELRQFKADWERRHPPPQSADQRDELARETFRRTDTWLDQGMGSCLLANEEHARLVCDTLKRGDGNIYELGCFVVMPNHVHAIVRPLVPSELDLEEILKHWKGRSAYDINCLRGKTGALWQKDTYDRIVRDEEELWRVLQYIGRNPQKAGLDPLKACRWVQPSWVDCGWQFEDLR